MFWVGGGVGRCMMGNLEFPNYIETLRIVYYIFIPKLQATPRERPYLCRESVLITLLNMLSDEVIILSILYE